MIAQPMISFLKKEENDENERMWLCYDEDNARCISNFKLYISILVYYNNINFNKSLLLSGLILFTKAL